MQQGATNFPVNLVKVPPITIGDMPVDAHTWYETSINCLIVLYRSNSNVSARLYSESTVIPWDSHKQMPKVLVKRLGPEKYIVNLNYVEDHIWTPYDGVGFPTKSVPVTQFIYMK